MIRWTTPVSRKRITYHTERIRTTKIRRLIMHSTWISFRVDIIFEICSSSRSIKRRRFDDELVESSLGTSGNLASKMARTRMQSTSSPGLSQYNTTYSSRVPSTPSASCASGQYVMKSLLHVTLHQLLMNKFHHVKKLAMRCVMGESDLWYLSEELVLQKIKNWNYVC
jgi:hypothetical protein